MDTRYQQANKEALLSLLLTFIYLITWILTAYYSDDKIGLLGLPMWFELSCLFTPIGFILLCWCVITFQFKNIPLDQLN